jgi:putative hydroxymethylpyrimidine transport system substrate-binding protein
MKRRLASIVVAVAGALTLAACGEKKDVLSSPAGSTAPLSLMLDWVPNADHVGIYQALSEGDFTKAGLDVHIRVPGDPASPLQLLAAGKVDAAISYEPEVLLARNRGLPLVSVAAIVQTPLTSLMSLPSKHNHIRKPADLRGKRVGDAGIPYQHAYLTTILAHANVPVGKVKEINVGTNLVPAMISGRVDATLGAYWNVEAIELLQRHKHPDVIHMEQVGVPSYNELVLVVRRSTIMTRPNLIRRFVQALGRGYESVRRNPAEGVASLLRANTGLDQKLQAASVRTTLPVFFPTAAGKPWGWQDPAQWNAYGQWMLSNHLISNPSAVADASTNELLAGQGL